MKENTIFKLLKTNILDHYAHKKSFKLEIKKPLFTKALLIIQRTVKKGFAKIYKNR